MGFTDPGLTLSGYDGDNDGDIIGYFVGYPGDSSG